MLPYSKCEKWDAERFLLSYDPQEVEKGEEKTEEYTKQVIVAEVGKGAIVEALVRKEYSVSDELGLLRQRESKQEEFAAYNARVEEIKQEADAILAGLAE